MTTNNQHAKFMELMEENVLKKLEGSHPDFKRLESSDKPSKTIVLGSLGDRSKDYSTGLTETRRTLTSVKNNSLSVKFLVKNLSKFLRIKPSFSVYYRVYPTFNEQKEYRNKNYKDENPKKIDIPRIWKRKDCLLSPIDVDMSKISEKEIFKLDIDHIIEDIKQDDELYAGGKEISSEYLKNSHSYEQGKKELKNKKIMPFDWKAQINVEIEKFKQNGQYLYLITISLVNNTEESKNYETFLFNCNLETYLGENKIIPFKYDYEYEGFSYSHKNHIRCLNCHADYSVQENKIITKNYSNFSQDKIVPRTKINSTEANFENLLSRNTNIKLLEILYEKMSDYLNSYKKSPNYSDENGKYRYDVEHFIKIKERFLEGIDVLKQDKKALKAFEFVNKSFKKASPYDKWRLFQIIFIVSLIPDIIDKTKRRDICEVLHVPTGGGKSEAYFACVLFSAFWDRLSGKQLGTTAISKFPLRMLSIQQLQRIANLLIWAEEIRKEEQIGGEPFSVAYFVGSTDEFPRHTKKPIGNIQKSKTEIPGKIIDICPICEGSIILDYKKRERYIIHRCRGCNREYRLFFTDEEIYRFLPTFIVSTVDKLAGIAMNRRFKNIFGGKIDQCPEGHGFIPHNDKCEVWTNNGKCDSKGKTMDTEFKTGPTLIIQDEMHLVREGFGTINSHFESLMEALQKEFCGYGFKNIAMTATITGAREQIEHLYHKQVNISPGDSPEGRGKNDFFFDMDYYDNGNVMLQRRLIGLKPNFRDNQYASLLTLKYISKFINNVESNIKAFSEENGFNIEELEKIVGLYKYILTYHNKKSDVHSMNYYLDTVVNSKLDKYKINAKVLTGDNTLDDIKGLINLIDKYFADSSNKNSLLSTFATSIVSHGIDIDKWNLMIFQGIPRNTAEYIQALSRVGRRFPGLVFVWFYPNRTRDLSFYQNFPDYHEFLEHKVEDVPLSRWAKLGFYQTFTSIFNASILNYFSDLIGEPIYTVDKVNEVFEKVENRRKLIEFIKKAYVSDSPMIGSSFIDKQIADETEKRLNYLVDYTGGEKNFFPNALKDSSYKYYRTQYGMRGIQDEVILKPSYNDLGFLRKTMK